MKAAALNIAERVVSTFLFTFISVAAATGTLNLRAVSWQDDALIAGGAAVQSLVKNVLAYTTAKGNGPEALVPEARKDVG